MIMIRAARNGCSDEVIFHRRYVYFNFPSTGIYKTDLGKKLDMDKYIESKVDPKYLYEVKKMMQGWELYEKGWYFHHTDNKHLFYHLTQISDYSTNPPFALKYFKFKIKCWE